MQNRCDLITSNTNIGNTQLNSYQQQNKNRTALFTDPTGTGMSDMITEWQTQSDNLNLKATSGGCLFFCCGTKWVNSMVNDLVSGLFVMMETLVKTGIGQVSGVV